MRETQREHASRVRKVGAQITRLSLKQENTRSQLSFAVLGRGVVGLVVECSSQINAATLRFRSRATRARRDRVEVARRITPLCREDIDDCCLRGPWIASL